MSRKEELKKWCNVFLVTFFAGLITHFQMYSNELQNPDSIWLGDSYTSGGWEVSLGRWGLPLADAVRRGVNAPAINAILAILLFSVAIVMALKLLFVKRKIVAYLAALTFIASPFVSMTITYRYCALPYSAAYLLAVASVYCVAKCANIKLG